MRKEIQEALSNYEKYSEELLKHPTGNLVIDEVRNSIDWNSLTEVQCIELGFYRCPNDYTLYFIPFYLIPSLPDGIELICYDGRQIPYFHENIKYFTDVCMDWCITYGIEPSVMISSLPDDDRIAIATNTEEPDILDMLVTDKRGGVRMAVASHKFDRHLDILVHDELFEVRMVVAKYGRDKDLDILVHDPSRLVRYMVVQRNRPQDARILKNDTDYDIRQYIADYMYKALKEE